MITTVGRPQHGFDPQRPVWRMAILTLYYPAPVFTIQISPTSKDYVYFCLKLIWSGLFQHKLQHQCKKAWM